MNNSENFRTKQAEWNPITASAPNLPPPPLTRAEFGKRYGRSAAFAYRMIYHGRVKVIPGIRFAIPVSEVLRFESEAVLYNDRKPGRRTPRHTQQRSNESLEDGDLSQSAR